MTNTINIEGALEKARVKRDLADRLAALSIRDQRDVLVDLLAGLEMQAETATGAKKAATNGAQTKLPIVESSNGGTDGEKGLREKIVATLRATPRAPIKSISTAVYGDASKAHVNNIRANLTALGKQERLKNVGFGKWEVAKPPAM